MKTRYKIGKFRDSVSLLPGDTMKLTLTEHDEDGIESQQRVSEEITVPMHVTHWVMFYVPGVGIGGMFGGPNIESKLPEIFVDPECVNNEAKLITE